MVGFPWYESMCGVGIPCTEISWDGISSRAIAPMKNCPLTLKLTLTPSQTLTLPGGQFSCGAIVGIPKEPS